MGTYIKYWKSMVTSTLFGNKYYYLWTGALLLVVIAGIWAYAQQAVHGMIVTNMTDQVSWGAYIANFTFLVGVAAAAVMLVIPAYLYKNESIHKVVLLGELMAIAAIVMCLLFVVADLGSPQKAWHLMPFIGRVNFPSSLLTWDVLVLNGYLLLNLHIPGYLLYCKWKGVTPKKRYYMPFVFLSVAWAISIHTVTAFLYSGLGGRHYWNSAIVAPRFLASAFAGGPALMIIVFQIVNKITTFKIPEKAIKTLGSIVAVALVINLFLLGCEVFYEFYSMKVSVVAAQYLFFGLHGHNMLVPYIWTAVCFNIIATLVFIVPRLRANYKLMNTACILAFIGIWVEKGMGLIIPGFIPSPLGDVVEYTPSMIEIMVSAGIWALGFLIYTLLLKAALPILTGENTIDK